jgi:hypothetical protein
MRLLSLSHVVKDVYKVALCGDAHLWNDETVWIGYVSSCSVGRDVSAGEEEGSDTKIRCKS